MSESTVVKDSELGEAGKVQPVESSESPRPAHVAGLQPWEREPYPCWSCGGQAEARDDIHVRCIDTNNIDCEVMNHWYTRKAWNTRSEDVETLRTQLAGLTNCGRSDRESHPLLCNICNTCLLKRWNKAEVRVTELEAENHKLQERNEALNEENELDGREAAERMRQACVARVKDSIDRVGSDIWATPAELDRLTILATELEAITLTGEEDAEAETTV